jgi:nitric oxide reductase NorD protein
MFEFEPDEYIFTKLAYYFKRKRKEKAQSITYAVKLEDLKPRLTILARAITGQSIEIFPAEREGGYKNNNFFLPPTYAQFKDVDSNISFYLFRVLYLSIQNNLALYYIEQKKYTILLSKKNGKI